MNSDERPEPVSTSANEQSRGELDLCPYCLQDAMDRGGFTDEHVVGDAFGSRRIIRVCRTCNNAIGREIEGVLHGAGSAMSIFKWVAGTASLSGTAVSDDDQSEVDVIVTSDGRPLLAHPVVNFSVEGHTLTGELSFPEGTSKEKMSKVIRTRLEREGVPNAESLASQAVEGATESSRPVEVSVHKELDVSAARRHVAKVALAAVVTLAGDSMYSEIADALRSKLHDEAGLPEQHMDSEGAAESAKERLNAHGALVEPPSLGDGRPAAQVLLADAEGGTLVEVHILGQPHPAGPFVVEGDLAQIEAGLVAVTFRETSKPFVIERFAKS